MNKIKKGIAIILSAAIAVCTLIGNGVFVSAESPKILYELVTPEGYEVIETTTEHIVYRNTEDHYSLKYHENFSYNQANISVNDGEQWAEIYAKYEAALDIDRYYTNDRDPDMVWVGFYDVLDEGDTVYEAASITDKTDIIKEMLAEAYDGGILVNAEYSVFEVDEISGQIYDMIYVRNFDGIEDDIKALALEYYPEAVFQNTTGASYEAVFCINYFTSSSVEEMEELCAEIEALREGCTAEPVVVGPNEVDTITFGSVDILAELENAACDIDNSGTTDITDAQLILDYYAQSMAGIETASADTDKMDVNGDGAVSVDDAAYVLRVYAENMVGL